MIEKISRRALLGGSLALAGGLLAAQEAEAAGRKPKRRVVVWSEGTAPKKVYPNDVNTAIAEGLKPLKGFDVTIASLNDPDQGLPQATLAATDVLIWWGHQKHGDVADELVERIVKRVKEDGMGFIATHSAHYSKPLKAILGTNCGWKYYIDDGAKLDVKVVSTSHPIAKGVKDFVVPHTERYGDPFEVPTPDTVIFDGIYTLPDGKTGEHAQQGMVWQVGKGRVFYFQPGHEGYPIYFQDDIRQIFRNGVQWVASKQATAAKA
jgi:trehalose utilization protein